MPNEADNLSTGSRYLEVTLGTEKYVFPLLIVREVIAPPKTTPIPNSPAYFVGMMNLRGQVLGVVDLRKRLSIPISKDEERRTEEAVVIVEIGGVSVGTYVDSVSRVLTIPSEGIHEPPETTKKSAAHVTGIYELNDELITVIDLEKVLDMQTIKSRTLAS